ncbi:MAG: hypothetical protein AAF401_15140 [Pseudomonadota bacterium]
MRILIAALFALSAVAAQAKDKYVGYYYPEIGSEETFDRQIADAPPANKAVRVGFVTSITKAQLEAPESPRFVLFAKGGESDTMIMVALDDDIFKSIYRARALMAQLTSNIRGTAFFKQLGLETAGTFYDMLQMMEFDELIISDGETWSHRVSFVR